MTRKIALGTLLAVSALSLAVSGFQAPSPAGPKVVEVEKIKDNLFMLTGGGGNTAVFVGTGGVVVVDTKLPGWGQPILEKIKELTPKPVTTIINTHTHGDHVSGNVEFPATVDIVTQENTKANMQKMTTPTGIPAGSMANVFEAGSTRGMPRTTFKDTMTLAKDADRIDLYYFGRGHTNGDAFIVFPELRVAHAGDIFSGKNLPLLEKIKSVTDKPIVRIINTHTHGDHVSGNVEFPATVDVVTHENTKKNMEAMRPAAFVAPPAGGPPPNIFTQNNGKGMAKRTYKDKMTIGKGADQVDLYYFGRAHTNGDTFVFFPALRILHAADVFPNKGTPGMDMNNGGSGAEYAGTLTKAADFADKNNVEMIVNGHNDTMSSRADLRQYIQFVGDYVKFAQDEKKAGKSVDDAVKEWKVPAKYTGYNTMPNAVRDKANFELVYKETK